MTRFILAAILGLGLAFGGGEARADDDAKLAAGRKAITAWLAIVDSGDYAKSYDEAASAFKTQITREQWIAALGQARAPLGAVKTRTLIKSRHTTQLPNAPEGDYVLTVHETQFENGPLVVELNSAIFDADGAWRVTGYFLRPKPQDAPQPQ